MAQIRACLIGEFSNVHRYLRDGVRELGHVAVSASHGDFFKAIPADMLMAPESQALHAKISAYVFGPLRNLRRMSGYDVVQFINPQCFAPHLHFNAAVMTYIRLLSGRMYVIASGDDARYWQHYSSFRYNPIDDYLKIDAPGKKIRWKRWDWRLWSEHIFRSADGIVPLGYEFGVLYQGEPNCRKPIALPVKLSEAPFRELEINDKVIFFHGLNRPGAKGTQYIDAAMEKLIARYPRDITYIRAGHLSFFEYQRILSQAHVVLDQTSMYHYGMNAAIAMAMGKVVMSGAEPEALAWLDLPEVPPIINITPDPEKILLAVTELLASRVELRERGAAGRVFAEKYHDHVKVAERFITEWNR